MSSMAAGTPSNAYALKAAAVVAPFVDANLFSGLILVAHRGRPIFHEAFGLANREWMIANTPDTRFRIGSITKQFTATAIVLLAGRGKLNLADSVSTHYANAPESWCDITIHQLLTHTSGIPSYTGRPDFVSHIGRIDHTPEQILDLVRDLPLEFPPGERFSYCNSGYALLGLIVEKVSGQTYSAFLQSEIFDPLGMSNTGYDETRAILPRRAAGYERHGGKWINALFSAMSVPYAAGGLYSTADDLLRWTEALSNGKVISAALAGRDAARSWPRVRLRLVHRQSIRPSLASSWRRNQRLRVCTGPLPGRRTDGRRSVESSTCQYSRDRGAAGEPALRTP
ncbi:serine hydrolase domain-containing protein [Paraburkholderia bryophila]|uniref:CubicO group peptidase (Beta-lactamase class C family) n=1 Tax=Paraburkholderia bryophila TaxID=420952 RepID=A0A7Y9W2A5_9BURK|nr:serine hydrolase domain-containing protein [Paraburkholderia bryophila]NYH12929.1 CubicO group peptidase (beta-lactamase class C family) [Paraburkholderia bryophila]